jgi:hypothetical protein
MLSGGVRLKPRVQHAKIDECRDRGTPYWLFRYWVDELSPDGSIKTSRKRRIVGPIKGEGAITRKAAEIERDRLFYSISRRHRRPVWPSHVQRNRKTLGLACSANSPRCGAGTSLMERSTHGL